MLAVVLFIYYLATCACAVPEAGSSLTFGDQRGGQKLSFLGFGQSGEQSTDKVYFILWMNFFVACRVSCVHSI